MGRRIIRVKSKARAVAFVIVLTAALMLLTVALVYSITAPIKGGETAYRSVSGWQLQKYSDTELLRQKPYCYAPWVSYVLHDSNVHIGWKDNLRTLTIDAAMYEQVAPIAEENKRIAKEILAKKPKRTKTIRYIYNYCKRAKHVDHVKTARDVLADRQGDCAAHAAAVCVLCKVAKIPVRYCIGWTDDGLHAWNRVKVGGKWYWMDSDYSEYLTRRLWDYCEKPMEMW